MAKYMLDTDTVSFHLQGHGRIFQKILNYHPSSISISSISLAELRFGADRRKSKKLHALITDFIRDVMVEPFDQASADKYGVISTFLASRGSLISEFDILIAAHALTLDRILVTHNLKHFERIPGLKIEDWY